MVSFVIAIFIIIYAILGYLDYFIFIHYLTLQGKALGLSMVFYILLAYFWVKL